MKKIISMMMVVICICGTHYNVRAEENEYIESDIILEDGFIEEIKSNTGIIPNSTQVSLDWTVKANVLKRTSEFYKKQGSNIYTKIDISPAKKARIGIIQNGDVKMYYDTTTGGRKTFTIKKAGTYSVFVQNMMGSNLKAKGYYKK